MFFILKLAPIGVTPTLLNLLVIAFLLHWFLNDVAYIKFLTIYATSVKMVPCLLCSRFGV